MLSKVRTRLAAVLLGTFALAAAAEPLSAVDAHVALQQGATAWDVRAEGGPMLPAAARVDAAALHRWLHSGDIEALSRAVSDAGIDLSRDVVLYGDAGDARAQALHAALAVVATGRVHWLVGGVDEWRLAGLPLAERGEPRWPVPQRLQVRDAATRTPMAAPSRRGSHDAAAVLASR